MKFKFWRIIKYIIKKFRVIKNRWNLKNLGSNREDLPLQMIKRELLALDL